MNSKDAKLTTDVTDKNLVYLSEEKLDDLRLPDEKPGWDKSASVSASASFTSGVSVSASASANSKMRKMSDREKLTEAGKLLKEQVNLFYEDNPRPGSYLLVRLVAAAGTMWPSDSARENMNHVAWWVGEGKDVKVLAYGSLSNTLQTGYNHKAESTWSPSAVDAHSNLINSVVSATNNNSKVTKSGGTVREFLSYCFNSGVVGRGGTWVHQPGIYDMLLRVDGVEEDETENKKRVVYGSPIWVTRVPVPVPGVYKLEQKYSGPARFYQQNRMREMTGYDDVESYSLVKQPREIVAYGVWDGKSWVKTYWAASMHDVVFDRRVSDPEVPESLPKPEDIVSLGIPRNLRKKKIRRGWEWDDPNNYAHAPRLSPPRLSVKSIQG
ncbi:hypothetical protein ACLUU3_06035 [Rothia mucilaginosa]|uniref:hypothetical protein n=1 Tax=Rothia mucilaginosa TaxID=43675 RepID=UPI0039A3A2D0